MRCPSCGITYRDSLEECAECGPRSRLPDPRANDASRSRGKQRSKSSKAKRSVTPTLEQKTRSKRENSRLIEFPGTSRNPVPEWRKELSVRVRKVQEKRAREAAIELAEAEQQHKQDPKKTPPLELIPQTECTPVNPIVAAALRRIERAHISETPAVTKTANPAVAVAYAGGNRFQEPAGERAVPREPIAYAGDNGFQAEPAVERAVPSEPVAYAGGNGFQEVPAVERAVPSEPVAYAGGNGFQKELAIESVAPREPVASPFAFLEEGEPAVEHAPEESVSSPFAFLELAVEPAVPSQPTASPFAFLEEAELAVEPAVPREPLVPLVAEQLSVEFKGELEAEETYKKIQPTRLIRDDPNNPALNYLDYVPTTIRVEELAQNQASLFSRLMGALADLLVVTFMSTPLAAAVELSDADWHDPRIIGLAMGAFVVITFLYLTVSTAFTGRTLGMRLLALRVVDARTGLIPTGNQAAGRAFLLIVSLLSGGIVLLYPFLDSDHRIAHDRFTRTAVVRA